MDKNPKLLHISWDSYGKQSSVLAKKIKSSGRKYDLVIGIVRGGITLSLIIGDELDIAVDMLNIKSYLGIAKRTKPKIISTLGTDIKGKRILVVDDLVDEGETMVAVIKYLSKKSPSRIDTAALYTKPWSKFKPDFSLKVIREWAVFPWDRVGIKRIRKS